MKEDKVSIDLSNCLFVSSNHSKHEKGVETASVAGCWKGIQIHKNSKNDNSYSVTIRALDKRKSKWETDVQMSIKQMRIGTSSRNRLELCGYGDDSMGVSFSDYGIVVLLENNTIVKIVLQYLYRNVELHYAK